MKGRSSQETTWVISAAALHTSGLLDSWLCSPSACKIRFFTDSAGELSSGLLSSEAEELLCAYSEFWWFSSIEKATWEVLVIAAKRNFPLGNASEDWEDYLFWEGHDSHPSKPTPIALEGRGGAHVLVQQQSTENKQDVKAA